MSSGLSSPRADLAWRFALRATPAMRRHWLAGSIALHVLLAALMMAFVSQSRPAEAPSEAMQVDLVAAEMSSPPASQPAASEVPMAPLPTEAPPVADAPPPPAEAPPLPAAEQPPLPAPAPPPLPTQTLAALEPPPPQVEPPPRPSPARGHQQPRREPQRTAAPAAPPQVAASSVPKAAEPVAPAGPQPGWERLLASWLATHRSYPEDARRRGDTGDVTLRIAVAPDGRVTGVSVVASTASHELTDAAVAVFTGAVLPPPHSAVVQSVRLRYRLED